MMTIEEFKKIPDRHRFIFTASSLDKHGEYSMREWWADARDCFEYLDKPYWRQLRIGRDYMVDVWNEVCDNHPNSHYPRRSKETSFY